MDHALITPNLLCAGCLWRRDHSAGLRFTLWEAAVPRHSLFLPLSWIYRSNIKRCGIVLTLASQVDLQKWLQKTKRRICWLNKGRTVSLKRFIMFSSFLRVGFSLRSLENDMYALRKGQNCILHLPNLWNHLYNKNSNFQHFSKAFGEQGILDEMYWKEF